MIDRPLGPLVRSLRSDLGLSQDDLSERANVSRGWVSRVENGDIKRPDPAILERLAAALNVPASNLLAAAGYRAEPLPTPEPSVSDLLRQAMVKMEREPTLDMMFKGYERLSEADARQFVDWALKRRRQQDKDDAARGD